MRRLTILCLVPYILSAADHWVKFTSPPFEIFSDAGSRPAREALVRFHEFRHALGQLVGEPDLQTPQPVRVMIFQNPKGWATDKPIIEGRDRYAIVLSEKTPALYRELTRLLLKSNTTQMPAAFEHGLVEFLSTLDISGIRINAGAPPE